VVRRFAKALARFVVGFIVILLILLGLALSLIETGWAKNRLRELIVRQANEYLTATLTIGRLQGSLLRGIQLGDINLSRGGRSLVRIDEVALSYSLQELFQSGTVIRSIRLIRPRFELAKQADGRWDLAAIVRRERQEERRTGPGRPIVIQSIEIDGGRVLLHDPLDFGAAHAPTEFDKLDARFSFAYFPVRWRLDFTSVSWIGRAPELSMNRLSGALGNGPGGWFFDKLSIETPRSAFTLDGRVVRGDRPTELDLTVHAARFAFQEWSGVLRGLRNIAVDASFDTTLRGPLSRLQTDLRLTGTGGSVDGHLTLDTTVPGWHGAGAVNVGKLNLAHWLNNPDRPSDITGHVTFNLALELGRHFPRGVYTFDGPHAMFMEYAADNVKAHGQITSTAVLVGRADARAYGAQVSTTDGSIGIDSPYPYRFQGTVTRIDLRDVPATVPVPHVESLLTFDYDVSGTFSNPFITGRAQFAPSTFLGAALDAGTVGTIDTSQRPIRYSGDGTISKVNLGRFGEGLDVAWLRDPRYAGVIAGRFQVEGSGTDRATMTLTGGGRLSRAEMFHGTLEDADVTIAIDRGTLKASYAGHFTGIDPAIPFDDPRWQAELTGTGSVTATVTDLLLRETTLDDYDVDGSMTLQPSTIRRVAVDRAEVKATLRSSTLSISQLDATGSTIAGRGSGAMAFRDQQPWTFDYDVTEADLSKLQALTGREAVGVVSTKGRVTGPWETLHFVGDGSIRQLDAFQVTALALNGRYDATIPTDTAKSVVRVEGDGTFLTVLGQPIQKAAGTIALDAQQLNVDLKLQQSETRNGVITGTMRLRQDDRALDVTALTIALGRAPWTLDRRGGVVTISWDDHGVSVTPAIFTGGNGDERVAISGTWRDDGSGALKVTATHVFLDSLQAAFDRPTRYGGVLDADVTIRGTRQQPLITGTLSVTNGRVERLSYQKLAGRVDYARGMFTIDLRLDQSADAWFTAVGTVPRSIFDRRGDEPMDVRVKSSGISLGLLEGLTSVVRNVSGQLLVDVRIIGTSRDPHFTGAISIDRAGFDVAASGAKYKNVRIGLTLASDRVDVEVFHIEDDHGRPLELRGSLGTHELQVGDLQIEVVARRFEVLRNEFGRMDIEARLQLRGQFESPRLTGDLTISSGDLRVDEILQRTLFQPYATQETAITEVDAVAALNPWERVGINLTLRIPNTLRLVGDNVQISPGTPIGLGDINLRAIGELYLYKDPGEPLYVTGSLDRLNGTYAFQGRRFDVDPASAVIFRGDLYPDIYLGVRRTISGVDVRVGLIGPMKQPELRLSSTPPLSESDILSLIVFNMAANLLTPEQQQQLVVRAGTLAAGFLAAPIVSAISNQIGLDVLEIEAASDQFGNPAARLTIGQEIAPGLMARFSRQFGPEPYDEATIEYYLSRILRLRATFSDAQTTTSRSPFRRVERAGLDLLFFFSF